VQFRCQTTCIDIGTVDRINMKPLISLGLSTIISFTFAGYPAAPTLAQVNKLPKVGILKNKGGDMGCYLSFANARVKSNNSLIFYSGANVVWMNLDGKDTKLTEVSHINKKDSASRTLKVNNLKIKIDFQSLKPSENNLNTKAKITMTRNGRSQVIQAIGYCGC
jgi:hypothetical protein